jgi:probable HAF family extracellular repeat protein
MRKTRLSSLFSLFVFVLSCFCTISSAQQAGTVESMKLLTPEVGWAATHYQLFWTRDSGRHWTTITPSPKHPAEIASAFFLNDSVGWVLLTRRNQTTNDVSGFDLASTANGGASWTIAPIKIPDLSPQALLPGDGRMDFIDPLHGWINLGGVGSAAMNAGFILATTDGGKTWTAPHGGYEFEQGGRGPVHFISLVDGWFTNRLELFVTHDGSNTWRKLSLKPPPEAGLAINPAYDVPVFRDDRHGFLPVTYSAPYSVPGARSALVLFATQDAGQTWKAERILPNLPQTSYGQIIPSAIADSSWIAASTSDPSKARLTIVSSDGRVAALGQLDSGASEISFASSIQGWAIDGRGRLLSTADGGSIWTEITPGAARTQSYAPARKSATDSQVFSQDTAPTLGSATISVHLGFDEKLVAAPTAMQTWWNSSPYFDAAFYLNGGHNRVTDPNLNSGWVSGTSNQGWGLIPAWVDLQAPCACKYGAGTYPNCTYGTYSSTISTDLNTANQQGVTSADTAAQSAHSLGINGKIIYADIEQYDIPSSLAACGPAVVSFLNGWISEVHAKGYLGGVYGSPADAANWNTNLSVLPEDVWIAKQDNRATIWGLGYGLADSMWSTNQRIHQYKGTHNETWGGTQLQIDSDVEDAGVIGGPWTKTYSFNISDVTIGSFRTDVNGINNLGQQVGIYYTAPPMNVPNGFVDAPSGPVTIDYPGAISTYAEGVNDLGQVVGYFVDSSAGHYTHGFWYKGPGNFTQIDYPGASDTYVYGINDNQQIVGCWGIREVDYASGGFLYKNGTFTDINVPGGSHNWSTTPYSINGDGHIAGLAASYTTGAHGFIYNLGQYSIIDYVGASGTWFYGINNNGQIVGVYEDQSFAYYNFLYDENTAKFALVPDLPSGSTNATAGINDQTQVVGSTGTYGFVATPK